ncbi:MAG: ABA4-like family protein [Erythrobacter sp.]|uniref:ABA4-like family protein n=1 Tax=Erythrobacter sp. TaxID=1042 RepID=UPI003297BF2B
MDWDFVFKAANVFAFLAWVVLIFLPRRPALLSAVLYFGVGILCLAYTTAFGLFLSGLVSAGESGAGPNFTTIEGVRDFFASDGGVTIGWIHYLAFDLFVGLWIARDADSKSIGRFIQAPILILTFLVGPVGLFVWLIIREPAARRQGRWN